MNAYRPRLFRFEEIVTAREGSGGLRSPRGNLVNTVSLLDLRSGFQNSHLFSENNIAFFEFFGSRCLNSITKVSTTMKRFFALIFEFVIIRSRVGARVKERLLSDHRDSPSQQQEVAKASIP